MKPILIVVLVVVAAMFFLRSREPKK